MTQSRQTAIPSGRLNRALRLGRLAGGIASTALSEGARQWLSGAAPDAAGLLLHPANAERIVAQLSQMRGAVMKVGQLLSMEAGEFLPAEATEILARLQEQAHHMPPADVEAILLQTLGPQWSELFLSFELDPFAAASIGQVHRAVDIDGRRLAVKIQYPGVADSIDSDIDNVSRLFKLFRLVPPGVDLDYLMDVARRQLHQETDYRREAKNLGRYRSCLGGDDLFRVPEVIDSLCGSGMLTMTYLEGDNIGVLAGLEPEQRNRLLARIIDLTLREFLHWGLVQSDPNFANFRFDAREQTIGLIDFGALIFNPPQRGAELSALLQAALARDLPGIVEQATRVGYLRSDDDFNFRMAIADLIQTAAEPAMVQGRYDFGASDLSRRLTDKLMYLRGLHGSQTIPPVDVLFLHRKLAGIYLLCARVGARIDVRACLEANLASRPVAATAAAMA